MENQFDLKCPKCGESGAIDVAATVWVRLMEDGTDAGEAEDGDHEWDGRSAAKCCDCCHTGTVAEFEGNDSVGQKPHSVKVTLSVAELGTVLAALRYWQREGLLSDGVERDIATDGGTVVPLDANQIDALCERIN